MYVSTYHMGSQNAGRLLAGRCNSEVKGKEKGICGAQDRPFGDWVMLQQVQAYDTRASKTVEPILLLHIIFSRSCRWALPNGASSVAFRERHQAIMQAQPQLTGRQPASHFQLHHSILPSSHLFVSPPWFGELPFRTPVDSANS